MGTTLPVQLSGGIRNMGESWQYHGGGPLKENTLTCVTKNSQKRVHFSEKGSHLRNIGCVSHACGNSFSNLKKKEKKNTKQWKLKSPLPFGRGLIFLNPVQLFVPVPKCQVFPTKTLVPKRGRSLLHAKVPVDWQDWYIFSWFPLMHSSNELT